MSTILPIYFNLFFLFLTTFFVILVLVFVTFILSAKVRVYYTQKVSPYECGFEPFHSARRPFNVNFYNYALLFLLFDIELILLLPVTSVLGYVPVTGRNWLLVFILILSLGLYYELNTKALYIRKGQYVSYKKN